MSWKECSVMGEKMKFIARLLEGETMTSLCLEERLSLKARDEVVYKFKKPWDDRTTAIKMTQLEFIEKLVALVPRPRVHLTRFHGVLGPHYKYETIWTYHRQRLGLCPPVGHRFLIRAISLLNKFSKNNVKHCSLKPDQRGHCLPKHQNFQDEFKKSSAKRYKPDKFIKTQDQNCRN